MCMQSITTGIDRLLRILKEKGRIQLEDLAKELNLDENVVTEWIELLEQEDLVVTNKKMSKLWVEPKTIDEKKVAKVGSEITSQKQAFSRKIEVAIKTLEKDTAGFEDIKTEFKEIQSHIKSELETVRSEMKELEQYDKLKKNINNEIEEQKKNYEKFIKAYELQINEFEKKEFNLIKSLKNESEKAEELQKKVNEQQKQKKEIEEKINDSIKLLKEVSKNMDKGMSEINSTEKRIIAIRNELKDFNINIEKSKGQQLKKLADQIQVNKEKIDKEHTTLLKNSKLTLEELKTYSETQKILYKNFEGMFGKKIKITETIENIEKEKEGLKKELLELDKKVKVFTVLTKDAEIKKQMSNIEKTMKEYDKRKQGLVNKIYELTKLIGQ